MLGNVVKLQLERVKKRVEANHGVPFEYGDDVVKLVVSRCNEVESGGRIVDAILTNTVLPRVSIEYLTRMSEGKALARVKLGVADGDFTYSFD
jgi:type VI secretion system protein VasG